MMPFLDTRGLWLFHSLLSLATLLSNSPESFLTQEETEMIRTKTSIVMSKLNTADERVAPGAKRKLCCDQIDDLCSKKKKTEMIRTKTSIVMSKLNTTDERVAPGAKRKLCFDQIDDLHSKKKKTEEDCSNTDTGSLEDIFKQGSERTNCMD
jgi:hypothetical protein